MSTPNQPQSRLSHAYILSGGSRQARQSAALQLACRYVCTQGTGCGQCQPCHKVQEGIHPDVNQVAWVDKPATVAQIRELRADAYVLPNEAKRKVYIIDQAHGMHPSALNALLKVLEEGPSYGAFLLLCQQENQMLPTIRSRCEHILLQEEEPQPDPALVEQANQLLTLAFQGDELAWMAHCVSLEKLSRDQWADLLTECRRQLMNPKGLPCPRSAQVALVTLMGEMLDSLSFHVAAGHLAGWLGAGAVQLRIES